MKFPVSSTVRLTELKTIKTKATEGKESRDLTFATVVNTSTFEFLTTILALADGQTLTDIVEQRDYSAVVEYDGKWGSVTLTPTAPALGGFGSAPAAKK